MNSHCSNQDKSQAQKLINVEYISTLRTTMFNKSIVSLISCTTIETSTSQSQIPRTGVQKWNQVIERRLPLYWWLWIPTMTNRSLIWNGILTILKNSKQPLPLRLQRSLISMITITQTPWTAPSSAKASKDILHTWKQQLQMLLHPTLLLYTLLQILYLMLQRMQLLVLQLLLRHQWFNQQHLQIPLQLRVP